MVNLLLWLSLVIAWEASAQNYPYAPSAKNPYGLANPKAPSQIQDFKEMIGTCHCKSVTRIDQNSWADTVKMTWTFKYIMDGMAIQDETYKADGIHSGSIRQFNADSSKWFVHYYSVGKVLNTLPAWSGNRAGGKIILYSDQPAPNGTPGYYRLTFSEISGSGYNWTGEWVNKGETFSYPTWKIFCKRN